jgi:short-subunit dehydrogenase
VDGGLAAKRVLVTGASSGIGAATALRLAREGALVLVHGRDEPAVTGVARRTGGVPVLGDLSTPDGVRAVAARAGELDVLVNNAGVGWAGPLTAMRDAEVVRLIRTNLVAPIELTRAVLPAMLARGTGTLVFVTSIAGRVGVAEEAVYAATKGGLDAFAESLRYELGGTGVRVGVVIPGVIDTPFFERRGRPYQRGSPKPISPERVAAAIVTAITRGRAEAYVPRWLGMATGVRSVAPRAYRALATRFGGQGGPDTGPHLG